MPYATQADLTTRFSEAELVELTNRTLGATTVDTDVLARALSDADAEIDARLATRFALPLASVPLLLVNLACDIARYRLYDDRASEQVTKRYEAALRTLDQLRKGEIDIGLTATAQATPSAGGPQAESCGRVFSRSSLADYAGGEC